MEQMRLPLTEVEDLILTPIQHANGVVYALPVMQGVGIGVTDAKAARKDPVFFEGIGLVYLLEINDILAMANRKTGQITIHQVAGTGPTSIEELMSFAAELVRKPFLRPDGTITQKVITSDGRAHTIKLMPDKSMRYVGMTSVLCQLRKGDEPTTGSYRHSYHTAIVLAIKALAGFDPNKSFDENGGKNVA